MAKTYVYFNLHKHVWSCMVRGIVQRHSEHVFVSAAEFVVRAAGHRKVLEQKRKNVHAFVRGRETSEDALLGRRLSNAVQISYNPFKGAHFYRKDTGEVVKSASLVELRPDKTVWAWGVVNA